MREEEKEYAGEDTGEGVGFLSDSDLAEKNGAGRK
jgi:hypothetical protein